MALITKKIKGTEDVLPKESYKWQFVEKIMREEARSYGFREIRTPVFEHTELFARGVGQTTDVVQKEMYTFDTKGGESVTLRPEGTAGAASAVPVAERIFATLHERGYFYQAPVPVPAPAVNTVQ